MIKRVMWATLSTVIAILFAANVASADFKIKTKTSMSGQSYEGTTYIKKSRQRTEQNIGGMSTASILQCDLQRSIQINDAARTYMIMPFESPKSSAAATTDNRQPAAQAGATRRGGIVTYTTTITDTGERKQMFGLTARHLKMSMVADSTPDACTSTKMRMEIDGWYVDLQYGLDCQWNTGGGMTPQRSRPDCLDEYRFKRVGIANPGYALQQTTTMYDENGRTTTTFTSEVLELSNATLDAALFEVPAGYKEAKDVQELYSIPTTRSSQESPQPTTSNQPINTAGAAGAAATAIPGTVSASAPKKAGAVRIGLVVPKTQMSDGVSGADAAEAVRNTLVGYLNGPSLEVVLLTARLPQQAIEEARQSQCDFVLFTSLTQKKGGGGGRFGRVLGSAVGSAAASAIPYGNSTGEAVARSAATSAIYTTAAIASSIKAKDEVSLEYELQAVEGGANPVAANTLKAKAKSDGEDVITPLVEKTAQAVVASATKR